MNYATWKLNFEDPKYGTGPEDEIAKSGIKAEAAWVLGQVETGGTVLGYVSEPVEESELTTWQVKNLNEEEAIEFCLQINAEAYLLENGKITAPIEELAI